MTKTKAYLIIQSLLCIALAVLMAAAVIGIYREGMAVRESTDVLAPVFTEERIAAVRAPIIPLLFVTIGMAAAGLILGIRGSAIGRGSAVPSSGKPGRERAERTEISRETAEDSQAAGQEMDETIRNKRRRVSIVRGVLLAAAVGMIIAGICNGSMRDVLIKAINICTECIGLG